MFTSVYERGCMGKIIISSALLLYAIAITNSQDILEPLSDFNNSTDANVNISSFVNCGHVNRLLTIDDSLFGLGQVLDKCWHYGVTLDELERGITSITDRPDIENFGYDELFVPCNDVFGSNVTKLTTRLLQDFIDCKLSGELDTKFQASVEERYTDIIDVYVNGNASIKIYSENLVPCWNTTGDIGLMCRLYGLTQDQISTGFLRYYYNDRWVIEEDIADLSLTCDRVFNAKLHEEGYEDPVRAFLSCLKNGSSIEPEKRDSFEKKYATKLMEVRAEDFPDSPNVDLRGYISCRRLLPLRLTNAALSPSWDALKRCGTAGVTYEELQNGTGERIGGKKRLDKPIAELYISCESVFTKEFWSFTTGLLSDFEMCKKIGKVNRSVNELIEKRFSKLFQLFSIAKKKVDKSKKVTEDLVHCYNFAGGLEDLCRRRGSTLAQEMRGLGSLAKALGDRWLNVESLDNLYVRCDDIFDDYINYLKDVPVDQFMQCRWIDGLSQKSKAFIDKRIAKLYKNTHRWNGTTLRGGANGEIASQILFD